MPLSTLTERRMLIAHSARHRNFVHVPMYRLHKNCRFYAAGKVFHVKEIETKIKNQLKVLSEFSKKLVLKKFTENHKELTTLKQVQAIDILKTSDGLTRQIIDDIVADNVSAIKKLKGIHLERVTKIFQDGFAVGKSNTEIARAIAETKIHTIKKARSWARDQTGTFYGKVAKVQQQAAGFDGYIWRGIKDSRLRDTHSHVIDKFYRWDSPPQVGNRFLHPGEDYNCRCLPDEHLRQWM